MKIVLAPGDRCYAYAVWPLDVLTGGERIQSRCFFRPEKSNNYEPRPALVVSVAIDTQSAHPNEPIYTVISNGVIGCCWRNNLQEKRGPNE